MFRNCRSEWQGYHLRQGYGGPPKLYAKAEAGRYVFVGVITVIAAGVPLRNTRAAGAVLILDNPCLLMRHQRQRDGIHIGEEPV